MASSDQAIFPFRIAVPGGVRWSERPSADDLPARAFAAVAH